MIISPKVITAILEINSFLYFENITCVNYTYIFTIPKIVADESINHVDCDGSNQHPHWLNFVNLRILSINKNIPMQTSLISYKSIVKWYPKILQ